MEITGIILAGGKSTRMGTDKILLKVNGKTLLEGAIYLVKPFCNSVLISSNNIEHSVFGTKIIADEIPNCGPLGGIHSCLKNSETAWNFVISADAAFVEPEFLKFLFSEIDECDAVVPFHSKGKEPLIALYNKSGLPRVEKMLFEENYKMHHLIHSINTKFVDVQMWLEKYPKLLHNINRPEDL